MSDTRPRCTTSDETARQQWVFTFSIDGDLRFISHRDTMRLFQRAFARADLPVSYSEGFNPHARLSMPLPRPVGVASRAEALVVTFETAIDGDSAMRRLDEQMPDDIRILSAQRLAPRRRLHPTAARYRLEFSQPGGAAKAAACVATLQRADEWTVERHDHKTGESRMIDARPFIESIRPDDDAVEFTLRITSRGSVKPAEIATLLGCDNDTGAPRVTRLDIQWRDGTE